MTTVSLDSLLVPADAVSTGKDLKISCNGRSFVVRVANLSTNPEARRLQAESTRQQMLDNDGKMGSPADLMPDYDVREENDIRLAKMAITGWTMTEADAQWLIPERTLQTSGVEHEIRGPGGGFVKVTLRSAHTPEFRELESQMSKRALRNNEPRDFMPPQHERLKNQEESLRRLLVDWGIDAKIDDVSIGKVVREGTVFADNLMESAGDAAQYSKATQMSAEALVEAEKTSFPFNDANLDKLVKLAIPFREKVVSRANDESRFTPSVEELAEKLSDGSSGTTKTADPS